MRYLSESRRDRRCMVSSMHRLPLVRFIRPLFHVNIYPTGTWAFSTLGDLSVIVRETPPDAPVSKWLSTKDQDPMRLATLLCSIQSSLDHPNLNDPAHWQSDAYTLMRGDPKGYEFLFNLFLEALTP
ncbi:hypothetical protein DFH09DRAFT_331280 [Mycena vulgaris]|nr:hypothetical protein DFH09DRAFT_331280 [Mycena vulgaris]